MPPARADAKRRRAKKIRTLAIKPDGTVGESVMPHARASHVTHAASGCPSAAHGDERASCHSGYEEAAPRPAPRDRHRRATLRYRLIPGPCAV